MLVIPAIDIRNGQCVRLRQGRMAEATVFSDDPVDMAVRWARRGARRLHVVDLDGAFAGAPVNRKLVAAIAARLPRVPVQAGGGVRTLEAVRAYVEAGVRQVVVGTRALEDPEFVGAACEAFPGRIIVGIDAVDGKVATDGWAKVSSVDAADLAGRCAGRGVSAVIHTDVARDGMMRGLNVGATVELAKRCPVPVIASGGVAGPADIAALQAAARKLAGGELAGVIAGRALYEGALDFAEAQRLCDPEDGSGPRAPGER